jgi:hypothetical protein
MGRSVSFANGSEVIIYSHIEDIYDDDDNFDEYATQDNFDSAVEYLKETTIEAFPSLSECNVWLGNEDHAILENQLVYIGLSEYCGLISVWVVPKDDELYAFGVAFAQKIKSKLNNIVKNAFGIQLKQVGRFSNGEALFERV